MIQASGTTGCKTGSKRPTPSITGCRVLIVDDEPEICDFIKKALKSIGIDKIDILHDGKTVYQTVQDSGPDLVILDLHMPGVNGMEVLETLRADARYDELPVIVETGSASAEETKQLLSTGASNVIRKPIDELLVLSRVRLHLEKVILLRRYREYHDRLEQELNAAHEMQKKLLPRDADVKDAERLYGVAIGSHYQPSTELGGDLWGIQYLDGKHIGFYLVDFSGHGVGASINTFRLHTMMQQFPAPVSPARYLRFLNSQLHDIIERGQFASMVFALINIEDNTLTYATAGAPAPIVHYPASNEIVAGEGSGLPIGIVANVEYEDIVMPFPPDASVLLYSDALYEFPDYDGEVIGLNGVSGFVKECLAVNQGILTLDALLGRFFENHADVVDDDLTLVLASRNSG